MSANQPIRQGPPSHSFCWTSKKSCIHSKWFGIALLVASIVIFGCFAAMGGIGLFSSTNALPDWITSAIGTIGPDGCWAMFIGGSILGVVGGIAGAVLLVKAWIKESVNRQGPHGLASLHHATMNEEPVPEEIIRLIEQGADVNIKTKNGATPLLIATSHGSLEAVQALLTSPDIDLEIKNSRGCTALFVNGDEPLIAQALLDRGADVNVQNNQGRTPLHEAIFMSQRTQTFHTLLRHGKIDVNIKDNEGNTPLHVAVTCYDDRDIGFQAISALLEKGAKIDITNKQGQTPLDLVDQTKKPLIYQLLVVTKTGL